MTNTSVTNSNETPKRFWSLKPINLTRENKKTFHCLVCLSTLFLFLFFKLKVKHLNYTRHLNSQTTSSIDPLYTHNTLKLSNISSSHPKISSALWTSVIFLILYSLLWFLVLGNICAMVYATAEILQLRLSLLRQSKPSILTAAGLWPNFIRTHPLADEDGEEGAIENGLKFPFPNSSSWMTGFEALLGGDPEKKGGDEATWLPDLPPSCKWNWQGLCSNICIQVT